MIVERIRKITNEKIQKLAFWGLLAMIFILPVPQFLYPENRKMISLQATILMFMLFFFAFLIAVEGINKRFRLKGSDWAIKWLVILATWGVITVFYAEKKRVALYGCWNWYEGLFTLLSYYSIFLVTTFLRNEKFRRILLYCFLGFGVLVSVYGILQFFEIINLWYRFPGMACVPMRNPNFYATFAIMFTGIAMGGFFLCGNDDKMTQWGILKNRGLWYLIVLLGYSACIAASSTVAYVGLIMILILYLFLEIVTKKRRFVSYICLVLSLVAVMLLFNLLKRGAVSNEFFSVWNQIQEEGSVFGDSVGTRRMMLWKVTCALLPEYGLFGCGIDHLGDYILGVDIGTSFEYFDKAHNEYLHIWVTQGILAVISHIAFLCALFFPGLKRFVEKVKKVSKGVDIISEMALFAFFGYIAQAFFSVSVVQVAPYFWMICGLLYRKKGTDEEATDR